MKKIYYILASTLLLGFHYALILYVNSSFLSKYFSTSIINTLYIAGAIFNIFLFLLAPKVFNWVGVKAAIVAIVVVEFFTVISLANTSNTILISILFMLQQAFGPLILYSIDLLLESLLTDEGKTGVLRSIIIASLNLSLIISFLFIPHLIHGDSFSPVYSASAFILIPMLALLAFNFGNKMRKSRYTETGRDLRFILKNKDILRVMLTDLTLQTFYTIMVIYLPLLLLKNLQFNWSETSLIMLIMLFPFIIFNIPIGKFLDKKPGAKEFLFVGLIIMAVSCFNIYIMKEPIFWFWALTLFMSRIGASLVEVSCESFFFKRVTEKHSGIISLYRMNQSTSNIIAPTIALLALNFTNYAGLFGILGLICIIGVSFIPQEE